MGGSSFGCDLRWRQARSSLQMDDAFCHHIFLLACFIASFDYECDRKVFLRERAGLLPHQTEAQIKLAFDGEVDVSKGVFRMRQWGLQRP